jgi:K+-sensing histidine kinase KdpD
MNPADPQDRKSAESINVAWSSVVRFVRQLSHDLRNHLNAAELQAAFLGELTNDTELKAEIKRLRQMVSEFGTTLQKLSQGMTQSKPNFMAYRAADFVEDIRHKVEADFAKEQTAMEWDVQSGEANIQIDPQLLQQAVLELFANAFAHGRPQGALRVAACVEGDEFVLVLRERKEGFDLPTAGWGREPLRNVKQGHYGLGLNRVRTIVESHGGALSAHYDKPSATLSTTIALPLAAAGV